MRLSKFEVDSIKKAFQEVFAEGDVYLFGSRIDDKESGGDIDLYLVPKRQYKDLLDKKIEFLIKLEEYIGEQKIDVVIAQDKNRLIEQEAIQKGIKL